MLPTIPAASRSAVENFAVAPVKVNPFGNVTSTVFVNQSAPLFDAVKFTVQSADRFADTYNVDEIDTPDTTAAPADTASTAADANPTASK